MKPPTGEEVRRERAIQKEWDVTTTSNVRDRSFPFARLLVPGCVLGVCRVGRLAGRVREVATPVIGALATGRHTKAAAGDEAPHARHPPRTTTPHTHTL